MTEMTAKAWRKSSRCETSACVEIAWHTATQCDSGTCVQVGRCELDNCVEAGQCPCGTVHVRDSKLGASSPILSFTPQEWAAFTAGVKDGEFDTL